MHSLWTKHQERLLKIGFVGELRVNRILHLFYNSWRFFSSTFQEFLNKFKVTILINSFLALTVNCVKSYHETKQERNIVNFPIAFLAGVIRSFCFGGELRRRERIGKESGSFSKPRRRRQRERHETKGLMSRTIALYISLPSSTKQQREMTKFFVFWRMWTTIANFF